MRREDLKVLRLNKDNFFSVSEDIKALMKISMECSFQKSEIPADYYEQSISDLERFINDGSAVAFVCIANNKVQGWIWCYEIHRLNNRRLHVTDFAVTPDEQRRGIGSILIDTVEKYADENGFDGIDLMCSESDFSAKKFYLKHGYEPERYLMAKYFRGGY